MIKKGKVEDAKITPTDIFKTPTIFTKNSHEFYQNSHVFFMEITEQTGLVLEGGGMRGIFTCGVLDAFMKHEVWFNYVIGVSAGAGNGASYISKQIRRARYSNIDLLKKYDFIGFKTLVTRGTMFDMQLLYDKFPKEIFPYDFETYQKNPAVFEAVTTNCLTGRAEYFAEKNNHERLLKILRASASLPYISKMVEVDGVPMLDGGLVDSIPVERAMATGHPTNIVILTRNVGYRKKEKDRKIPAFIYKKYPRLRVALSNRAKIYNTQLELVEKLEAEGKVICIRPENPIEVDRIEKNVEKLEALYQEGYRLGERFCLQHLKTAKP